MKAIERFASVVLWIATAYYVVIGSFLDSGPPIARQIALDLMIGSLGLLTLIECIRFFRQQPINFLGYAPVIGSVPYVVIGISYCILMIFIITAFVGVLAFTGWGA